MSRTDPALALARHLAHEAQNLTAAMMLAATHTTRHEYTRHFDLPAEVPEGGTLTSYHQTTTDEADMVCEDCDQPFGPYYASVTVGITPDGHEIADLLCVDCARLGRQS